jgi:hypothetical protein
MIILPVHDVRRRSFFDAQAIRPADARQSWVAGEPSRVGLNYTAVVRMLLCSAISSIAFRAIPRSAPRAAERKAKKKQRFSAPKVYEERKVNT